MSTTASRDLQRKAVVLVVEDSASLREGIAMNLRMEGYEALTARDGEEGMRMAFDARPDLVVLDIMLPTWSGLEILAELRRRSNTVPVLILSARGRTPDKVEGLGLGADDYLAKPFDLPELLARVKAMLRRRNQQVGELPMLTCGELTIDRAARLARAGRRVLRLTAKEFDLLTLLATSPGHVFTREAILERVWGWDYDGTARTVDNVIVSLRKKLAPSRAAHIVIRTIPRVGYTFDPA